VIVVAAVCVRLGFWQLDRLEQRRSFNAEVRAALASDPAPLGDVLADGDLAYRRVTVDGTWDPEHEVILFGRSLDGRPGNHVLIPLVFGAGRAVLVDRGWVPSEVRSAPVGGDAAASAGDVTVDGIMLPSDDAGDDPVAGGTLPAQVRSVDVAALDAAIPSELVANAYVLLERQTPIQERPIPAPLPELSEGPHLSYAIQWFTFAAISLVGYGVLARPKRREIAARQPTSDLGGN
jgi:cytochrome oxidase assembly protein ShyY1